MKLLGWAFVLLSFSSIATAKTTPLKIMPLGDSITYGTSYAGSYRVRLEKLLAEQGITVQFVGSQINGPPELLSQANEGHGGWKIADIASQVPGWLATSKPDIILLLIGTNDIWVRPPSTAPADVTGALSRMQSLIELIRAQSPGVKLVVGTVPFTALWWNPYVIDYNAALKTLVEQKAVTDKDLFLVDIYSSLRAEDLVDGVHPTQSGYDRVAQVWFDFLMAEFEQ